MTRVVIESPLGASTRAGIDANKAYARRCVQDSLRRGEAPYAAHLFYDQPELLDDLIPEQRQQGLSAGLLWATQAEVCAVYLDLGVSRGMEAGIQQARRLGQRVSLRFLEHIPQDLKTLQLAAYLAGQDTVLTLPSILSPPNHLEINPPVNGGRPFSRVVRQPWLRESGQENLPMCRENNPSHIEGA